MTSPSNLQNLFQTIRTAGFFKRLFSWKSITQLSADAERELTVARSEEAARLSSLESELSRSRETSAAERSARESAEKKYTELNYRFSTLSDSERRLQSDLSQSREAYISERSARETAEVKYAELRSESDRLREKAADDAAEYEKTVSGLQSDLSQSREAYISEHAAREAAEVKYAELKSGFSELSISERRLQEELTAASTRLDEAAARLSAYEKTDAELRSARDALSAAAEGRMMEEQKYAALKEEFDSLSASHQKLRDELAVSTEQRTAAVSRADELTAESARLTDELRSARDSLTAESEGRKIEAKKYADLKSEFDEASITLSSVKEQLAAEESVRSERSAEYERRVEKLNTLVEQMETDHAKAAEKLENDIREHEQHLATSWQRHETGVAESLKSMAKRYDFVWCGKDEYPNPGTPDNVFLIGGMYTVFDAKSPKNPEELSNFPQYLKLQAEGMKKYCKYENVRKDAFLVVPSTTLEVLTTFMYDLAEYTVYVITPEALLPILQVLKTIEGYEFAEQLSPEDRDKLCRFIGRLSHTTKRKVQIDTYFSREFVSVLRDIDTLPDEFAKEIGVYEQKAKLNPPMEKRAKMISVADVESDVQKVENDILGWSVVHE